MPLLRFLKVMMSLISETSFFTKLSFAVLTFFIVATLTFFLMKMAPGDPFSDEKALPVEIHQALLKHYGLEDPWHEQYLRYMRSIFSGDFGPSLKIASQSVNTIIKEGFAVSSILGIEALCIAFGLGISLGTVCAIKPRHWIGRCLFLITTLGISFPSFVIALTLQYFLALKWGLFPIARWGSFQQSILPALSLGIMPAAFIARLVRANLLEVLQQDYIRTAHAKGLLPSQVIARHALKNALAPLLPYFGQLTANILTGSFIIEKIFGIPGLGYWFVNSINSRDYPVIMGTTLFYSFILLTLLLLADFLYGILNPRILAGKIDEFS